MKPEHVAPTGPTSLAKARTQGAHLIECVLDGRLSPEGALDQWPQPIDSPARTLTVAWTHLSHFADDCDLHAQDPEYGEARRQELHRLAAKLRNEADEFGDLPTPGLIRSLLQRLAHFAGR